jgi:hypothetical protein
MKRVLGPVAAACLIVFASSGASAQSQPDQAAKLAEAHAIIAVMFPPAERQRMLDKMQSDVMAQMRPLLPAALMADPGLKTIIDSYIKEAMQRQRAIMQKHQPQLFEAMAAAYTHEFSLAELKDIHSFAESPSGAHYLSKSTAIVGDPAVAKVNTAMFADLHALTQAMMPDLKEKILAYLKAHPDVAAKLEAASKKEGE